MSTAPSRLGSPPTAISTRQLVRLEHASPGYGAAPVLAGVDWSVLSGDRIGLLGPNGAGKSTLLKAIAGLVDLGGGSRHVAQALRIGYFAQHQLEQLRPDETALWHLGKVEPQAREQDLRDFLGGFDFRGDMVTTPVGTFSGGEKARLTLALLVRQKPNLLLLDEPTNHLDIEMREALAEALQDYDGALVVVAHDRHLLRATTDTLWLVAEGRVAPFDGDLDDYRDWVLASRRAAVASSARAEARTPDRREQRRLEAAARQQRYARKKPLLDELNAVEGAMAALSEEKSALDAWLAGEEAYLPDNREALKTRIVRQADLTWELARLESEWLRVSEALETIE